MRQSLFLAALAATLLAGEAKAQSCSTTQYPYPLTNGSTADASQMTNDLNCAAVYGLANWPGNVGIGTTGPSSVLTLLANSPVGTTNESSNRMFKITTGTNNQSLYMSYDGTANVGFIEASQAGAFSQLILQPRGGNVGIGMTSPSFNLDVSGYSRVAGLLQISGGSGTYWPLLGFNSYYNGNSGGGYTNSLTGYSGGIMLMQDTGRMGFLLASSSQSAGASFAETERMSILENGDVGIGIASPTATLYVNGSTVLTQGYTTSSDARLKTDVTPITGALATVQRLEGVHYRWLPASERPVGKALNLPVDQPQIGFLAQAVQRVVPEAVTAPKTADDIYTLDPSKLIPILVEAIKEQNAKIAALEAKVAKLEAAR